MSFLRRRRDKEKVKTIRSESKLNLQKGMDSRRESRQTEELGTEDPVPRKKINFKEKAGCEGGR